jgi:hypothetical protein
VEEIQQIKLGADGHLKVLVKWADYPEDFNTWEPFNQMGNALDCVEQYLKTHFF